MDWFDFQASEYSANLSINKGETRGIGTRGWGLGGEYWQIETIRRERGSLLALHDPINAMVGFSIGPVG